MTDKEKELQAEAIDYYRKQIAELKDKLKNQKADYEIYYKSCYNAQKKAEKHLTKAKELLAELYPFVRDKCYTTTLFENKERQSLIAEAEQFLKDSEVEK